jgi:hypothetical protein
VNHCTKLNKIKAKIDLTPAHMIFYFFGRVEVHMNIWFHRGTKAQGKCIMKGGNV